jgi:hypothetical protein
MGIPFPPPNPLEEAARKADVVTGHAQRGANHEQSKCKCTPPRPDIIRYDNGKADEAICLECRNRLNIDTSGEAYRRWPGDLNPDVIAPLAEIHADMKALVAALPDHEKRRLQRIAERYPTRFEREAKAAIAKWEAIRNTDPERIMGPNTKRRLGRRRTELLEMTERVMGIPPCENCNNSGTGADGAPCPNCPRGQR